jgi:ACS family tartrate transporter-like MFS transporter
MAHSAPAAPVDRAVKKAAWRIMPLIMLMYILSYLDRVNVGFAAVEMNADLGLSATEFGIGAGLFFVGYIALEVPSNLILHRVGARVWIARIMITWGMLAAAMGFIQGEWSYYGVRLLLGVAEAGFVPGIILYTTLWFPRKARARIVALFLMAIPFAVVLGAPVSALMIEHGHGLLGLDGWRFMFIAQGVPAVVLGGLTYFLMPSVPERVNWLASDEKDALRTELDGERVDALTHGFASIRTSLLDWRVYTIALFGFCANMGGYSLSFFLPQVIEGFGAQFGTEFSLFQVGLITAIPFACAAIALWLNGHHSDKTGERTRHIALPLLLGAIAVAVALYLPSPLTVIIAISVAAAGSYAIIPIFWQLPSRFLTGAAAAAGMGLIAGLANVAGFIAPYMTGALKDATGDYRLGMLVVAAVMLVGAVVAWRLGRRPEFQPHYPPPANRADERAIPVDQVSLPPDL